MGHQIPEPQGEGSSRKLEDPGSMEEGAGPLQDSNLDLGLDSGPFPPSGDTRARGILHSCPPPFYTPQPHHSF